MKQKYEKVYVKVNVDCDSRGYMIPKKITWSDGRTFIIDKVNDRCPASTIMKGRTGECYTIVVHGKERYLFFERANELFKSVVGRWYVERMRDLV